MSYDWGRSAREGPNFAANSMVLKYLFSDFIQTLKNNKTYLINNSLDENGFLASILLILAAFLRYLNFVDSHLANVLKKQSGLRIIVEDFPDCSNNNFRLMKFEFVDDLKNSHFFFLHFLS